MISPPPADAFEKTTNDLTRVIHRWLITYKSYCSHSDEDLGVSPDCVDLTNEIISEVYLPW